MPQQISSYVTAVVIIICVVYTLNDILSEIIFCRGSGKNGVEKIGLIIPVSGDGGNVEKIISDISSICRKHSRMDYDYIILADTGLDEQGKKLCGIISRKGKNIIIWDGEQTL